MNFLFRVDADRQIGFGHAVRCFALAEKLADEGHQVQVASVALEEPVRGNFKSLKLLLHPLSGPIGEGSDLEGTLRAAKGLQADWIVLDGYRFSRNYAAKLRSAGLKILMLDDIGLKAHSEADILVNPNLHANRTLYPQLPSQSQALLGTQFSMLRSAFLAPSRAPASSEGSVKRVLITLGGTDQTDTIISIIKSLANITSNPAEEILLPHLPSSTRNSIEKLAGDLPFSLRFASGFSKMPHLIADSDLVITACGSTCWEIASIGRPAIGIVLSDNQAPLAEALEQCGAIISLGRIETLDVHRLAEVAEALFRDENRRAKMAEAARNIVDGRGTLRVINAMIRSSLVLREADENDARTLWEWVNEQDVRKSAFQQEPIPWDHHVEWFHSRLNDPRCLILIAELPGRVPVGQVRYEWGEEGEAVVDVSVGSRWSGRGIGSTILEQGSRKLFERREVKRALAWIKPENLASLRAFSRAGYTRTEATRVHDIQADQYVMARD